MQTLISIKMMQTLDPFTLFIFSNTLGRFFLNSMKGMQQPQQQFSFTRINQFLIFSKTLGTGSLSAVCRTFLSNDALLLPMMSWGALIRYEETSKRNAAVSILESSPISSRQDFIFFFSSFSLSCVLSSPWFNPWVMVSLQIV